MCAQEDADFSRETPPGPWRMPLTYPWPAVRLRAGALPRSVAPVQLVSRPPHTASRDCRNGSPLVPARSRVCQLPSPIFTRCRQGWLAPLTASRSCRVGHPLPAASHRTPTPERRKKRRPCILLVCAPTRSAASRAGMGWLGGADWRAQGERGPHLPARHVSTAPVSPPQKPGKRDRKKQQHDMTRHHTCQPRNGTHQQHGAERKPQ